MPVDSEWPGPIGDIMIGDVTLWGADAGARLRATDRLSFDGSFSWVTLSVNDLFDNLQQAFVGAPELGRLTLLRPRYDF